MGLVVATAALSVGVGCAAVAADARRARWWGRGRRPGCSPWGWMARPRRGGTAPRSCRCCAERAAPTDRYSSTVVASWSGKDHDRTAGFGEHGRALAIGRRRSSAASPVPAADRGDLADWCLGQGEEQLRVGVPAGGILPPVPLPTGQGGGWWGGGELLGGGGLAGVDLALEPGVGDALPGCTEYSESTTIGHTTVSAGRLHSCG